jgi:hypothetical protein
MNMSFLPTAIRWCIAALVVIVITGAAPAHAQSGSIRIVIVKAGWVVGVTGGSGTLTYQGKSYPLRVGGVSLGLTFGASKAELVGQVYNLRSPLDIAGTYTAAQAGLAIAGGPKVAQLKNSKGVVLSVSGKQIGLEFALDLSGIEIALK